MNHAAALDHLSAADPTMAQLITHVGPCRLEARGLAEPFAALLRSIVYQQISTEAAAAIHQRLRALFADDTPTASALLALDDGALRGAGLSRPKQRAARSLAERVLDGTVPPAHTLRTMADADIIERLSAVHGIGVWTAQMLLLFHLGRPDVLPATDLGVRRGYAYAYGLDTPPTPAALRGAAEAWQPFRSVAAWYLWRAA